MVSSLFRDITKRLIKIKGTETWQWVTKSEPRIHLHLLDVWQEKKKKQQQQLGNSSYRRKFIIDFPNKNWWKLRQREGKRGGRKYKYMNPLTVHCRKTVSLCLNLKHEIKKQICQSLNGFHNLKELPEELISLVMKKDFSNSVLIPSGSL